MLPQRRSNTVGHIPSTSVCRSNLPITVSVLCNLQATQAAAIGGHTPATHAQTLTGSGYPCFLLFLSFFKNIGTLLTAPETA